MKVEFHVFSMLPWPLMNDGWCLATQSRHGFGLPRVNIVIVVGSAVGIMRGHHGGDKGVDPVRSADGLGKMPWGN